MGGRRRKSSASVTGAFGAFVAHGTPSSSCMYRHHARMLANAGSQRTAWVLMPRSLNSRASEAVPAHVVPRNVGAPVLGATGAHKASETLSSSFTLRHHSWMQANAVSHRAVWVPMPPSLIYNVSNSYRSMDGRRRRPSASVLGASVTYEASETLRQAITTERWAHLFREVGCVIVPSPRHCCRHGMVRSQLRTTSGDILATSVVVAMET
jgi:hypothetical protein